jgi:hypothetical protein
LEFICRLRLQNREANANASISSNPLLSSSIIAIISKSSGGMGSPKAAKSMVKQRIWRHRLVAPFAAVLITAVVVFSGLFAQDPSGELDSYSLAASASFFFCFLSPLSPNQYVFLLEFIGTRSHLGVYCRERG